MDKGLDGLRCDSAGYLYEREGTDCENLPETHAFCKKLRAYLDENYPSTVLLAETNQQISNLRSYFGDGDEFHMCFNFPLMPRLFLALRRAVGTPIVDIVTQLLDIPVTCQWANFLRNHDELTLEMVTSEERDDMWAEYATDRRTRLNLGIRRRLAPLLNNSRAQIQLLNGLLFTLPGTPVIYYGDEIGMGDDIACDDRTGVRTPMQWSTGLNAGFSCADSLYCSVISEGVYGYQAVNVDSQWRDANSLLHWMKQRIAIRKQYPVFGRGDIRFLNLANESVLAFIRGYEMTNILILANLSDAVQSVELDLHEFKGTTPVELTDQMIAPVVSEGTWQVRLDSYGFYWFRLDSVRPQA
jgi:maltose alpha-D-glucosyltransferase/alpha-amylase